VRVAAVVRDRKGRFVRDLTERDFQVLDGGINRKIEDFSRNARHLVQTLTAAAPLVLFSAAVPSQGGSNHINEQWPSYWRALFEAQSFGMFDPIRPRIRDRHDIQWWYRQNIVMYVRRDAISSHPELGSEIPSGHELEWAHISMLSQRRDLRSVLPNCLVLCGYGPESNRSRGTGCSAIKGVLCNLSAEGK